MFRQDVTASNMITRLSRPGHILRMSLGRRSCLRWRSPRRLGRHRTRRKPKIVGANMRQQSCTTSHSYGYCISIIRPNFMGTVLFVLAYTKPEIYHRCVLTTSLGKMPCQMPSNGHKATCNHMRHYTAAHPVDDTIEAGCAYAGALTTHPEQQLASLALAAGSRTEEALSTAGSGLSNMHVVLVVLSPRATREPIKKALRRRRSQMSSEAKVSEIDCRCPPGSQLFTNPLAYHLITYLTNPLLSSSTGWCAAVCSWRSQRAWRGSRSTRPRTSANVCLVSAQAWLRKLCVSSTGDLLGPSRRDWGVGSRRRRAQRLLGGTSCKMISLPHSVGQFG